MRFHPGVSIPDRERALRQTVPKLRRLHHFSTPGPRRLARTGPPPIFEQIALVETADSVAADRAAAALAGQPSVLYVEPNYRLRLFETHGERTPNDFEFGAQWALHNTGQQSGQPGNDIRAADAWAVVREAPQVPIAVIDTGIDYYHPRLGSQRLGQPRRDPGQRPR
ncbi:MAG: hypothetical protein M5U12_36610 [Verrucomicrobia bacterium]|nr:hypothetical protein [Verrucomicrobiota bacterium]